MEWGRLGKIVLQKTPQGMIMGGKKLSRKVEANFIPRRHLEFISIPTQNFRCAMVYTVGAPASLKKILQSILDH